MPRSSDAFSACSPRLWPTGTNMALDTRSTGNGCHRSSSTAGYAMIHSGMQRGDHRRVGLVGDVGMSVELSDTAWGIAAAARCVSSASTG